MSERIPVLSLKGVNTHYGPVHILKDVDIDIYAGEMVCLLGGNASGKTTTLKTMLGYLKPSSGAVHLDGQNVNDWSTAQRVGHGLTMVPENRRLFKRMTVREKIGQTTAFTSGWSTTGPTMHAGYREDIEAGRVGAVFNAFTAAYTRELQALAVEATRLGIPLLFGYDVVHGYKTIFPIPLGEAASWDLEAIENAARVAEIENDFARSRDQVHFETRIHQHVFVKLRDDLVEIRRRFVTTACARDAGRLALATQAAIEPFQLADHGLLVG